MPDELLHYDVSAVARVERVPLLRQTILRKKDFYIGILQRAAAIVLDWYGHINVVMLANVGGGLIETLDENIREFREDFEEAEALARDVAWFVIATFEDARVPRGE
jgi:hypothetical protein